MWRSSHVAAPPVVGTVQTAPQKQTKQEKTSRMARWSWY